MKRLLNIEDGYNFRELGGYSTQDGRRIKFNRLIRSGSLTRLNEHDQFVPAAIPVKNDLDLRSNPEVAAAPDRVPTGATYRHLPVFAVDETTPHTATKRLPGKCKKRVTATDICSRFTGGWPVCQAQSRLTRRCLGSSFPRPMGQLSSTARREKTGPALLPS